MSKLSEIMLRRKNLVMLGEYDSKAEKYDLSDVMVRDNDGILSSDLVSEKTRREFLALTFVKNIESLGYTVSRELYESMAKDENLTYNFNQTLIKELEALKGADVEYNPMYKNFPKEVMEMSEFELYYNAIIHYWSGGTLYPQSLEEERDELAESVKLTKLDVCTEKDVQNLFANLLNSSTPWSDQDKEDLAILINNLNVKKAMPDYIVNHENMATLAQMLVNKKGITALSDMKNSIKSATDVLRVMNVLHGNGDATLKSHIKIKNMGRTDRKMYLELLSGCKNASKDMSQYINQWSKIERVLHPHDYKDNSKFANALKAFEKMRDEKTIYAEKEVAIKSGDIKLISDFYRKKPGMLAGDLDRLLRDDDKNTLRTNVKMDIVALYKEIAKDVSPKVLWEVHKHFANREREREILGKNLINTFYANGETKTYMRADERGDVHSDFCKDIVKATEEALIEIYKDKPAMGKVYIDPAMEKINVPNETRTASQGVVPLAPGSRIPMNENANVVRGFIWWTNQKENPDDWHDDPRVDIDLSAEMLDKELKHVQSVYYGNFASAKDTATFSGDITNGGDFDGPGVAEFLDVDLEAAKEKDVKYISFNVNSFTGQHFDKLGGHCSFGFMEREKELEGEIFEPSTVKQKINLSQKTTASTPCLFDVETKEMVWMDAPGVLKGVATNIENTRNNVVMQCAKVLDGDYTKISDVIRINALARGEIVNSPEEADITFGFDGDIKPTDVDYFSGNLLPKEVAPEYLPEPEPEIENSEIEDVNTENPTQNVINDMFDDVK